MSSTELGGALEQIDASRQERDALVRDQKKLLKESKKELDSVIKKRDKEIKKCESEIQGAYDQFSGHVQTVGNIVLYGDRIVVDGKAIRLSKKTEIEVHSGGNVYAETTVKGGGTSVAGAVIGGAVAGPVGAVVGGRKGVKSKTEVQDERKLFVSVAGEDGSAVIELDPKLELDARKLAAEAKSLIKTLEERKEKSNAAVSELYKKLDVLKEDTSEVDDARQRYEAQERASTEVIEGAKKRHEELVDSFDPSQIKAEKRDRRNGRMKKIASACGLVIGVLLALLGIACLTSVRDGALVGTVFLLMADALLVKSVIVARDCKAQEKAGE